MNIGKGIKKNLEDKPLSRNNLSPGRDQEGKG